MISSRMSLRGPPGRRRQLGQGSAWLLFDAGGELFKYQCYWMGGHCDDHLLEHAATATDDDAVAWAAARTPRARIRMPDHVSYWAGSGPRPNGFSGSWRSQRANVRPADAIRSRRSTKIRDRVAVPV